MDKAKTKIRKSGFVILVEGTMDVILSHQAGFENTVASLGTSLTQEQVNNLARLSHRFLFAFDADEAGIMATRRGVDIALNQNVDVAVVAVPKGFKDTAEVIKTDSKMWREALLKSSPYIDYVFASAFKNKDEKLNPAAKEISRHKYCLKLPKSPTQLSLEIILGGWHPAFKPKKSIYLKRCQDIKSNKAEVKNQRSKGVFKKLPKKIIFWVYFWSFLNILIRLKIL